MKGFAKLLILGGLLVASAAPALADEVDAGATGVVDNTNNTITLSNGMVQTSTLAGITAGAFTFAAGPFSFSPGATVAGFTTLIATQGTAMFYATSVTQIMAGTFMLVSGNGYFVIGGKDIAATYNLSTSGGQTTFEASAMTSPTPEPSSLLLLGTGLLGAAGVVFRKRLAV